MYVAHIGVLKRALRGPGMGFVLVGGEKPFESASRP